MASSNGALRAKCPVNVLVIILTIPPKPFPLRPA